MGLKVNIALYICYLYDVLFLIVITYIWHNSTFSFQLPLSLLRTAVNHPMVNLACAQILVQILVELVHWTEQKTENNRQMNKQN